jgi:hypothetical protein
MSTSASFYTFFFLQDITLMQTQPVWYDGR